MSVTILIPNGAIPSVDDDLCALVLGNLPGNIKGFFLGRSNSSYTLVTLSTNCPLVAVRHYMLVPLCHIYLRIVPILWKVMPPLNLFSGEVACQFRQL